jgi:hypothetical protein
MNARVKKNEKKTGVHNAMPLISSDCLSFDFTLIPSSDADPEECRIVGDWSTREGELEDDADAGVCGWLEGSLTVDTDVVRVPNCLELRLKNDPKPAPQDDRLGRAVAGVGGCGGRGDAGGSSCVIGGCAVASGSSKSSLVTSTGVLEQEVLKSSVDDEPDCAGR